MSKQVQVGNELITLDEYTHRLRSWFKHSPDSPANKLNQHMWDMYRSLARLTLSEARSNLAEAVNRVAYGGERIVLGRRGQAVAALISVEDLALFEQLLEEFEDRIDIEAAREALAESDERIPYRQVRRELGLTKK